LEELHVKHKEDREGRLRDLFILRLVAEAHRRQWDQVTPLILDLPSSDARTARVLDALGPPHYRRDGRGRVLLLVDLASALAPLCDHLAPRLRELVRPLPRGQGWLVSLSPEGDEVAVMRIDLAADMRLLAGNLPALPLSGLQDAAVR
jgi:hypothetical protein